MSRHAESDPDRLDQLAAEMPAIAENRVDGWDDKPWTVEQVDPVEDVQLLVRWVDEAGRHRTTLVGDGARQLAVDLGDEPITWQVAQERAEGVARGEHP